MPKPRSRRQSYDPPRVIFDSMTRVEDPFNLNLADFEWRPRSQSWRRRMINKLTTMKRKWHKEADRYRLQKLKAFQASVARDSEWLERQQEFEREMEAIRKYYESVRLKN